LAMLAMRPMPQGRPRLRHPSKIVVKNPLVVLIWSSAGATAARRPTGPSAPPGRGLPHCQNLAKTRPAPMLEACRHGPAGWRRAGPPAEGWGSRAGASRCGRPNVCALMWAARQTQSNWWSLGNPLGA
jgi:hypothetical protein